MNSQKSNKIILLDDLTKLDDFDSLVDSEDSIITFDYKSHLLLSQKNVKHEISDSYLTTDEIDMLQQNSYKYSKFFNQEEVSNLMIYNGVQLGSLFYIELYVFLLPFLKKFFEIQKIHAKHPHATFISSPNLIALVKLFTDNINIITVSQQNSGFLYDHIKINFKINGFSFNIKIPNRYYVFAKNISDIITEMFSSHNFSDKSKVFSLLVEFDTIKYGGLFEQNDDFLVYNRRRPTIWNIKSYKIIKKSKSSIIPNSILKTFQKDSKNEIFQAEKITESLFQNENFFSEFFSLGGISFWEALKPHFISLCKKRFIDAIREITIAEQLFKKFHIKSILVWSENGFNELIIVQLGKKYRIPVILLQHGLYYDTLKAKELNEFQGILPVLSDKFAVWGNSTATYALDCGVSQNKILLAGNPSFDKLFETKHKDIDNEYVLLATQSPTNASINDLSISVIRKYEDVIKKVCDTVTKLNKKLVIKLHPDPYEFDITSLVNKTDKSIKVIKKGNIQDLIRKCELFIAIDVSTTILEAQILGKPTISIAVKDYSIDEDNCSIFTSQSCVRTKIEDLENILNKILLDKDVKFALIQNGNEYVNQYLSNQGSASNALSNIDL